MFYRLVSEWETFRHMKAREIPNSDAVQRRRERLKKWIDDRFAGIQYAFIASTNDGHSQLNAGEVSGLLRDKSFGEKRARTLEKKAGMPVGYLDSEGDEPIETGVASDAMLLIQWPFSKVSFERLQALQLALGARKGRAAVKDIDSHLSIVVQKWESEIH